MITREQQIKIISRNVKDALKEMRVKPSVLAEVADLAVSTVNRILEAEGMPNSQTINKLAGAFFCQPGDLLPELEELGVKRTDSLYAKRLRAA